MPKAVLFVISIFSAARYWIRRSLMNCSNGVAMARVLSFAVRMASITLDMSVIAGRPEACDRRSASSSPKPDPRRTTGGPRLVDEIDVEARQLLGRAFHPLDRLVHVVIGQLLDRERHRRHVDAFGYRLVELEHGARRNGSGEDHPDVQPPPGNALSHAAAPGVNARSSG